MIALLKYIVLFAILLVIATFKKKDELHQFDNAAVLPLRGLLCLLIVIGHTAACLAEQGEIDWNTVGRWLNNAPFAVSMFFFISGYGLVKSYKNKGGVYLKGFFVKRLGALLPALIITSVVYAGVKTLCLGWEWFRIWDPQHGTFPVESSWYVYALMYFYIAYYISYKYLKNTGMRIIVIVITVAFYEYIMAVVVKWSGHWYVTAPAFAVGVVFAEYEHMFINCIKKNQLRTNALSLIAISIIACTFGVVSDASPWRYTFCWFASVLVVMCVYQLGVKRNKWLEFCGKISYEMYLIHQLFIIVFTHLGTTNPILLFTSVILCAVVSGYLLNKTVNYMRHTVLCA